MIGYDIKGLMLRFAANVKYRGDRMWMQESLTEWLVLHETALPIICSELLPAVHRGSYWGRRTRTSHSEMRMALSFQRSAFPNVVITCKQSLKASKASQRKHSAHTH